MWLAWRERGAEELVRGRRIHVFKRDGRRPAAPAPRLSPPAPTTGACCSEQELEHAVLAFDCLGFGLSEKPRDHDYTLAEQADLAEELVAAHGRASRSSSSRTTWGPRWRPS